MIYQDISDQAGSWVTGCLLWVFWKKTDHVIPKRLCNSIVAKHIQPRCNLIFFTMISVNCDHRDLAAVISNKKHICALLWLPVCIRFQKQPNKAATGTQRRHYVQYLSISCKLLCDNNSLCVKWESYIFVTLNEHINSPLNTVGFIPSYVYDIRYMIWYVMIWYMIWFDLIWYHIYADTKCIGDPLMAGWHCFNFRQWLGC